MIKALILGVEEKHAADTNTNGVVGHIGRNKPMAPNPKKINPKIEIKIILTFKLSPSLLIK